MLDITTYKNEKYVYLRMAYMLSTNNGGTVKITGNRRSETRYFDVEISNNIVLLHEIKFARKGVMARRTYHVTMSGEKMIFTDVIEGLVNLGKHWDDKFQLKDAIKANEG